MTGKETLISKEKLIWITTLVLLLSH